MKKAFLAHIFIFVSIFTAHAQYNLKVKTDITPAGNIGDTLYSCQNKMITFYACAIQGTDTLKNATFYWDFNDGMSDMGQNLDTISHQYIKGGGYFVRLAIKHDLLKDTIVLPLKIALTPNFQGTKTNIEPEKGICKGDTVFLTGQVNSPLWQLKTPMIFNEIIPQEINLNKTYASVINFREFSENSYLSDISMLDSIGITFEHSNREQIEIKVICPSGKSVVLKKAGGNVGYLGEPVDLETSSGYGKGYTYYWTQSPVFGTINASTMHSLSGGTYLPDESLNQLIGCPLNGDWKIEIKDSEQNHNGFVFSWELKLNHKILPKWKFSNTYNLQSAIWDGDGINATEIRNNSATSFAVPLNEENARYSFMVKDNFGCWQDTAVFAFVERADISADPKKANIGEDIVFTDNTTWTERREWNFADKSPVEEENPATHYFENKGNFTVKLVAYSKSGCKDFDTVTVLIDAVPVKIEEVNVFTPNGDGKNDIFTFFGKQKTAEEKHKEAIKFASFEGKIWNRWGEPVCVWKDIDDAMKGWDGTYGNDGGREAQTGVYYFVIKAIGKDGKEANLKNGTIYLVRN